MSLHFRVAHARRVATLLAVGLVCAAVPSIASASTVGLATAAPFAVLGASTVTNTGPTVITGDLGVAPGTSLTGFGSPAVINGNTHDDDADATQAQQDLTAAYTSAASQTVPAANDLTGQDLGGMTLTPGSYKFSSSAQLTGTLTLNAEGDPNAQFVFEIGSTITTASASSVVMINGGSPCNVYWQVGSSATLGTTTSFQGNIMALASITLTTGVTLKGRALARNAAVTMDDDNVDNSMCTTPVTPPPTPTAELHVTKTSNVSSVQSGQDVTYTVAASNQGQGSAANVVLSDTLPSGMGFVSAAPGCADSGQTVTCRAGTIPASGSASFNIVAVAQQVSGPAGSSAQTSTSDQLTVVKAEQYITNQAGQTTTTDLSCGAGMFATDASVEVIHVDQGTGTMQDVQVQALDQLANGAYEAVVNNLSTGQSQAALFVACMSDQTEQGFPLTVSGEQTQTVSLTPGTQTVALDCGTGRTPITPSFDVTSGSATVTGITPVGTDEQDLTVLAGTGGAQIVAGIRCLEDQTGVLNGSVEQIGLNEVSQQVTVPAGAETSTQVTCGDLQKGIVGGWSLSTGLNSMGNEPQPKIRLFWIDNPTTQNLTGTLYLLCVNEYLGTATPTAPITTPTHVTNTVTGSTSSTEDSSAVLSASVTVTITNGAVGNVKLATTKALKLNAHNLLSVPLEVSRATTATVSLQLPAALRSGTLSLKAGTRLAHTALKTHGAGTAHIVLKLSRPVRTALHRMHRTTLELVVRDHGHVSRMTLKLKNA